MMNNYEAVLENATELVRTIKRDPDWTYYGRLLEFEGDFNFVLVDMDIRNGYFHKAAYTTANSTNGSFRYLGYQVNDDNLEVYPFDGADISELQNVLWVTMRDGVEVK